MRVFIIYTKLNKIFQDFESSLSQILFGNSIEKSREHALAVVSSTPLLFGTVKMGTDYLSYSIIYTPLKGSSNIYSVKYMRELSQI